MLLHPGIDKHIGLDDFQEHAHGSDVHRDCLTRGENLAESAQVGDANGLDAFENGRAVEGSVSERHPTSRRCGLPARVVITTE